MNMGVVVPQRRGEIRIGAEPMDGQWTAVRVDEVGYLAVLLTRAHEVDGVAVRVLARMFVPAMLRTAQTPIGIGPNLEKT